MNLEDSLVQLLKMSSVGITVNSTEFWKGTDLIEKKLGTVLDRKVASSTKKVLLNSIEFKEASKPDPFYQQLRKKYKPINSPSLNQQNGQVETKKNSKENGKACKDELPAPKHVLFERNKLHLQWKTNRSVGPGLFNLGNTCFLNSVIQVLTYTPPLVNYLATQEHSRTCKCSEVIMVYLIHCMVQIAVDIDNLCKLAN